MLRLHGLVAWTFQADESESMRRCIRSSEQAQVRTRRPYACYASIVHVVVAIHPHLHPWTVKFGASEHDVFLWSGVVW